MMATSRAHARVRRRGGGGEGRGGKAERKNCLRIHARDDFDFSEPLSATRLARKAMSLETRDDKLKMITVDESRA